MKKEKTMHELAKEFPEKTYRELELYRDADRVEEAIGIGHNHPPEEKGICIMGEMRKDREFDKEIDYHRYWKDVYEKEHKLRQEAEGELSIMKGIETNRVKEVQERSSHLQEELDRTKKDNNDLYNRVAELIEVNESHQKLNGKLQERLTELEEENKKMHDVLDKKLDSARKAGM